MLDKDTFLAIIKHTPLVSIDLIVTRDDGCVLLGRRLNNPARGFWFVPGGRIYKDEPMATAFNRICAAEIGCDGNLNKATLLGCYEHFYPENFAGESGISTHYVVLAYQLASTPDLEKLPDNQHDEYRWFEPSAISDNLAIHKNTRAYFIL